MIRTGRCRYVGMNTCQSWLGLARHSDTSHHIGWSCLLYAAERAPADALVADSTTLPNCFRYALLAPRSMLATYTADQVWEIQASILEVWLSYLRDRTGDDTHDFDDFADDTTSPEDLHDFTPTLPTTSDVVYNHFKRVVRYLSGEPPL